MSQQVTLVAQLKSKPGHEADLGQRLAALVNPTRAEAGCINYDLHRSTADPAVWMLYENWRSQADLDRHFAMPYLQSFLAEVPQLLAEEMQLQFYAMTAPQATR